MNYIKAQKEVFDRLVHGEKAWGYWANENELFISPNGYVGYLIPKQVVVIDAERLEKIGKVFEFEAIIKPENRLEETYMFKQTPTGKMIRLLKRKDGETTGVDSKLDKNFQFPTYYQAQPLR